MTTEYLPSSTRKVRHPAQSFIGIACAVAAVLALTISYAPIDWGHWDLAWLPAKARSYIWPLALLSYIFLHLDKDAFFRFITGTLIIALVGGIYTALAFAIWHWFAVSPAILAVSGIVLAVATAIAIFEIRLKRRVAAMGEKQVWSKQAHFASPDAGSSDP